MVLVIVMLVCCGGMMFVMRRMNGKLKRDSRDSGEEDSEHASPGTREASGELIVKELQEVKIDV